MPDRTHRYFSFDIFTTRNDRLPPYQATKSLQFHATRKLRCVHGGACVEATKIDFFGCLIQSQMYGNRSLDSYSLISFFEVAKPPLNCRGIFLPVYSSRAKRRCNCYLVSGLTHISHLPSILGMVGSIVQHALGCDCPCWPKPGWCSGRRRQHELLTTNWKTWEFPTRWGLNLPKWKTLKWWIHWDGISASSKRTV